MAAIATKKLRIHNAQQFFESLDEAEATQYYIFVGRVTEWPDENAPPTPVDNVANTSYDYWRDMIGAKQVTVTGVSHVIPRYNWTSNTVYTQYDHRNANLAAQSFYVVTSSFNVYKCLFNNGNANSTVEPTGTGNTVITTGDGYKWKFLYTISTGEALKFMTTNFMPVKTLATDDSSAQWDVQQYAELASSNGSLDVILVTDGGSGYHPSNTVVTIVGDGLAANGDPDTAALATATVTANAVTAITLTDNGRDYSQANVVITGLGSGATAVAIIPPPPYHGADHIEELIGYAIMINVTLEQSEGDKLTTVNNWRRLGLLRNPLLANNDPAEGSFYEQTLNLLVTGATGNFTPDEVVEGADSGAQGTVVDWNQSGNANTARLVSISGTFELGEIITGNTSGVTATVDTITNPELRPFSGDILYVEQRAPINRSNDQVEDIKLIIVF